MKILTFHQANILILQTTSVYWQSLSQAKRGARLRAEGQLIAFSLVYGKERVKILLKNCKYQVPDCLLD